MPTAAPSGYFAWVELAKRRILSVLNLRIAANIRQLEVKISESGPKNLRPEPHIVSDALRELLDAGIIRTIRPPGEERREETKFYTPKQYYPTRAKERITELLVPYRLHRTFTDKNEYCGDVLEAIVRKSFDAADGYRFLGKLPKREPLDAAYAIGNQKIGVEAKNIREWIYPTTGKVWVMIQKCLKIDALPLLVSRKTSFIARITLDKLGVMYFDVFRQLFSKNVATHLHDIQHTDLLGYKDVIPVPITPHPQLTAFLQNKFRQDLPKYRAQWESQQNVLRLFAITHGLGNKEMDDAERWKYYDALHSALFPETFQDDYPGEDEIDWEGEQSEDS